MNIIIVDDNSGFREGLKEFLEGNLGHKVVWQASNGEEFLEEAPIHKADIILMDIQMTGMNGIEATHKMNIFTPWVKIIAVTMHIEKVFLLQLIENGFKGCISKNEVYKNLEMAMNQVNSGHLFFPEIIKTSK